MFLWMEQVEKIFEPAPKLTLSFLLDDETKEANVAIHLCNLLAHSHLLCFFMTPFSATSSFFNTQQQNILQSSPLTTVASLSENHPGSTKKREKGHRKCCNFTFCCPFLWRNENEGKIKGSTAHYSTINSTLMSKWAYQSRERS